MAIGKIVIFFVILGLAACGADRCGIEELTQALKSCEIPEAELSAIGEDMEKKCSAFNRWKSCAVDATYGCEGARISGGEDVERECVRLEYSHASSTSVVNIVSLIAAAATLVPFS